MTVRVTGDFETGITIQVTRHGHLGMILTLEPADSKLLRDVLNLIWAEQQDLPPETPQ